MLERVRDFYNRSTESEWDRLETGLCRVEYASTLRLVRNHFPPRFSTAEGLRAMLRPRALDNVTSGFTDCYWSTPPEALAEVRAAGLEPVTYSGVEGFAGGMHAIVDRLAIDDPAVLEAIVEVAPETSELPQYRDATDHLHIVARRGL